MAGFGCHTLNPGFGGPALSVRLTPRPPSSWYTSLHTSPTAVPICTVQCRPQLPPAPSGRRAFSPWWRSRCAELCPHSRSAGTAYVSNKWAPGVVVSMCPEPNSYIVRLADGRLFRRTRSAINIDNSLSAGVNPPQLSGSFTMAPSRMQHLRPPTVPVLPPAQPPDRLPRPVGSTRSGRPYLKP